MKLNYIQYRAITECGLKIMFLLCNTIRKYKYNKSDFTSIKILNVYKTIIYYL